jgi:hypothetical protein
MAAQQYKMAMFARSVVCCFVLAAVFFGASLYGNLWRMSHLYAIDGPRELAFVSFIGLLVLLFVSIYAICLDIVRFRRRSTSSHG